jgi:tetratricopeptide (TPR) repeat protein
MSTSSFCVFFLGLCVFLASCSLFDTTVLEQQRAEIERLRQEAEQLRRETEALQKQQAQQQQQNEACNRAFNDFDAARTATDDATAIAYYQAGLAICPSDDVAHYELGEVYMRLGRTDAAQTAFEQAVGINPNFSRAQRRLEELGGALPAP